MNRRTALFLLISTILALAAVVAVVTDGGNPFETQGRKYDETRVSNFRSLYYAIQTYYQSHNALPSRLTEAASGYQLTDPGTHMPYDYRPIPPSVFELCTTFSTDSKGKNQSDSRGISAPLPPPMESDYTHKKGDDCIRFNLPLQVPPHPPIISPPVPVQPNSMDSQHDYKGTFNPSNNLPSQQKNNLLGWWKLDEGEGGYANDDTGHGFSGIINGLAADTWQDKHSCRWGNSCLKLDGLANYVELQTFDQINFSKAFSVSLWVKPAKTESFQVLIGSGQNGNTQGFKLAINANGNWTFLNSLGEVNTATKVIPGSWYHIVVTVDALNIGKLYVNGKWDASGTVQVKKSGPQQLFVGNNPSSYGSFFKGTVDEIRIYDRVLEPNEVTAVYSQNSL